MNVIITARAEVPDHLQAVGFIRMKNKCCPDKPVIITQGFWREKKIYSCQCACGLWVTTGTETPAEAVREWERMVSA